VLKAGGHVSIVWVTSGDGSAVGMLLIEKTLFDANKMRAYGAARMREARAASALLGVPPQGQLFLGYPDGALLQLLTENRTRPYTSRFTGAAAVPYPDAVFPEHAYTGASLEADLDGLLERIHPTLILAPSPVDEHSDHRATGLLTATLTSRREMHDAVRYWVVHGGEGWPSPRGLLLGVPLTVSPRGRALASVPFVLEPAEEDRKLAAVRAYDTQLRVMEPFLLAFVRTTELFGLATQSPAAP
jgi:LmbE family N-acetylglucosaminyl deacetylase